jgi:F0F1-type ATP synthase assembly protein I
MLKPPPPGSDLISHGLALVTVPVVLGLLGSFIDGLLGTGPVFLMALAALGVVGAFLSAYYRYERRIAHHDAGKPWTRRAAS